MSIEAMKQALEALNQIKNANIKGLYLLPDFHNAITALCQAIEQADVGDSEIAYALEPDAVKISLAVQEAVKEAVAEERAACASLAEQMVALRVAKAIKERSLTNEL